MAKFSLGWRWIWATVLVLSCVEQATGNIESIVADPGSKGVTLTYAGMSSHCNDQNARLCTYSELCNKGPGHPPEGLPISPSYWVAYDDENDWVDETCTRLSSGQSIAGSGWWSDQTTQASLKIWAVCCESTSTTSASLTYTPTSTISNTPTVTTWTIESTLSPTLTSSESHLFSRSMTMTLTHTPRTSSFTHTFSCTDSDHTLTPSTPSYSRTASQSRGLSRSCTSTPTRTTSAIRTPSIFTATASSISSTSSVSESHPDSLTSTITTTYSSSRTLSVQSRTVSVSWTPSPATTGTASASTASSTRSSSITHTSSRSATHSVIRGTVTCTPTTTSTQSSRTVTGVPTTTHTGRTSSGSLSASPRGTLTNTPSDTPSPPTLENTKSASRTPTNSPLSPTPSGSLSTELTETVSTVSPSVIATLTDTETQAARGTPTPSTCTPSETRSAMSASKTTSVSPTHSSGNLVTATMTPTATAVGSRSRTATASDSLVFITRTWSWTPRGTPTPTHSNTLSTQTVSESGFSTSKSTWTGIPSLSSTPTYSPPSPSTTGSQSFSLSFSASPITTPSSTLRSKTPSATPTATPTYSGNPTPTPKSPTESTSLSFTPQPTFTETPTFSLTSTATPLTSTPSSSATLSESPTRYMTHTPSVTCTKYLSPSSTLTRSFSCSASMGSQTPSGTSITPTGSISISTTATSLPTPSASPSVSFLLTGSRHFSPSGTPTQTFSWSPSATLSQSPSDSASFTHQGTRTLSTFTLSSTSSFTPLSSASYSSSLSPTFSQSSGGDITPTPLVALTLTRTEVRKASYTLTPTPSANTPTPTCTPTSHTISGSSSASPSSTRTLSAPSASKTFTSSLTPTGSHTVANTNSRSPPTVSPSPVSGSFTLSHTTSLTDSNTDAETPTKPSSSYTSSWSPLGTLTPPTHSISGSLSPTETESPSYTTLPTSTVLPSPSSTPTPSVSRPITPTPTASTVSLSHSESRTRVSSPSSSNTQSPPSKSPTPTITGSAARTPTLSHSTGSMSASPGSGTTTPSTSPSMSQTRSVSSPLTNSFTLSATRSVSIQPTRTVSGTSSSSCTPSPRTRTLTGSYSSTVSDTLSVPTSKTPSKSSTGTSPSLSYTGSPTSVDSPSSSLTASLTRTSSRSDTVTGTPSPMFTKSPQSVTRSHSSSPSCTPRLTLSLSQTVLVTPSPPTPTPTSSPPTYTPTPTQARTWTPSPSMTPTPSFSFTPTLILTSTQPMHHTHTFSTSGTQSESPSHSLSTQTLSPTDTDTKQHPTQTLTSTPSLTGSMSVSIHPSHTPTGTPSQSKPETRSATRTATNSVTGSPTGTVHFATQTSSSTLTSTATGTGTQTGRPSIASTATVSFRHLTTTPTPTATSTTTFERMTNSNTRTVTDTGSVTLSWTNFATISRKSSVTRSMSASLSRMKTPSLNPTLSDSLTQSLTLSNDPTITVTATDSAPGIATLTSTWSVTSLSATPSESRPLTPTVSPPSRTFSSTNMLTQSRSDYTRSSFSLSTTTTQTGAVSPTKTVTCFPTSTRTPKPTHTQTVTFTPSRGIEATKTVSPSAALTPTESRNIIETVTQTPSPPSVSATESFTLDISPSTSSSYSATWLPTTTWTPSSSPTRSTTDSPTIPSSTPSLSASPPTLIPTATPTLRMSPTGPTPSRVHTATPSTTASPTITSYLSHTRTPKSVTSTSSVSHRRTSSHSTSISPTPSPSFPPSPTPTLELSLTPTATSHTYSLATQTTTRSPSRSQSSDPTPTLTPTLTTSLSATSSSHVTPTVLPTHTTSIDPHTFTQSHTQSRSYSPSEIPTSTPEKRFTRTETRTLTHTSSRVPTSTLVTLSTFTVSRTPVSISPSKTYSRTHSGSPIAYTLSHTVSPPSTRTNTLESTDTSTPDRTPSFTRTPSPAASSTDTPPSMTPPVSSSLTPTNTHSVYFHTLSRVPSWTFSPTPSFSYMHTPTTTLTPTRTPNPRPTFSISDTCSRPDSRSLTHDTTPSPSCTPTPTQVMTRTYTTSRTRSSSHAHWTLSPTNTPTHTHTQSIIAITSTATLSFVPTRTFTATATSTLAPTRTSTESLTLSLSSQTPSASASRNPQSTLTLDPTHTHTPDPTASLSPPSPTPSPSPRFTKSPSLTPSSSVSLTDSGSLTQWRTGSQSATSTRTPTMVWRTRTLTTTPTQTLSRTLTSPTLEAPATLTITRTQSRLGTHTVTPSEILTPTWTPPDSATPTSSTSHSHSASMRFTQTLSWRPTWTHSLTPHPTFSLSWSASVFHTNTDPLTHSYSTTPSGSPLSPSKSPSFSLEETYTPTITLSPGSGTPSRSFTIQLGTDTHTDSPSFFAVTDTREYTATPTPKPTYTQTHTGTLTDGGFRTGTQTATPTPTFTSTPSYIKTLTDSPSSSMSPANTRTLSETWTWTPSHNPTLSHTATRTRTAIPTHTHSLTSSHTPSPSYTASLSPRHTATHTPTLSLSLAQTWTHTLTNYKSSTLTHTHTPSMHPSHSVSPSPSHTISVTPSYSGTSSPTSSESYHPSQTLSPTHTLTSANTASPTSSASSTHTDSMARSPSSTQSPTGTLMPTSTSTSTGTHTFSPSLRPTYSTTQSHIKTITYIPETLTPSHSHSPSTMLSQSLTSTSSPSLSSTETPAPTFSCSLTPLHTHTPSATPSPSFFNTYSTSPTIIMTPTPTSTLSLSVHPTPSPSFSPTISALTHTPTRSPSPSQSSSLSMGVSPTCSTVTGTLSRLNSFTSTPSLSPPSGSMTPSFSTPPTPTLSVSKSMTALDSASLTPTQTGTHVPTGTCTPPSISTTSSFTRTPTESHHTTSPTKTSTPTGTHFGTPSLTPSPATQTIQPTTTLTSTSSGSVTGHETRTPTLSPSPTYLSSPTPSGPSKTLTSSLSVPSHTFSSPSLSPPSASPSPSIPATVTLTQNWSPSPSSSRSPTSHKTFSLTHSRTIPPTKTSTVTSSHSEPITQSRSSTLSPSPTSSLSHSTPITPTETRERTESPPSASSSQSPLSLTPTGTWTDTYSNPTISIHNTLTTSLTPSVTVVPTKTHTFTPSHTHTISWMPTRTGYSVSPSSLSSSPSWSLRVVETDTKTATLTSATMTGTPKTPTPTCSSTPTSSNETSPTWSPSPSFSSSPSPTVGLTPTPTTERTSTPTQSRTGSKSTTMTPNPTRTWTPSGTQFGTHTMTSTGTDSSTMGQSPTFSTASPESQTHTWSYTITQPYTETPTTMTRPVTDTPTPTEFLSESPSSSASRTGSLMPTHTYSDLPLHSGTTSYTPTYVATRTDSYSPSLSGTGTRTRIFLPTDTATPTPSITENNTHSVGTATLSPTFSTSYTLPRTPTPTKTQRPTPSPTNHGTPSLSYTLSSPSRTADTTPSPPTKTPFDSPSISPSASQKGSGTPSLTESTLSCARTPSPTATFSNPSPSITPSPRTFTPSDSPTEQVTPTRSQSSTSTHTSTYTLSGTLPNTGSASVSQSATAAPTLTHTPSGSRSRTNTGTITLSAPSLTTTSSMAHTHSQSSTCSPTRPRTPTFSGTHSPTMYLRTLTLSPTATFTSLGSGTVTDTATTSLSPVRTATRTMTSTSTLLGKTLTRTRSVSSTPTQTPFPTSTNSPSATHSRSDPVDLSHTQTLTPSDPLVPTLTLSTVTVSDPEVHTQTRTFTWSPTGLMSPSLLKSPSLTVTRASTPTLSETWSGSHLHPSLTLTATATRTPTPFHPTLTPTWSGTPTPLPTPSTKTQSLTTQFTDTPTHTRHLSPSLTATTWTLDHTATWTVTLSEVVGTSTPTRTNSLTRRDQATPSTTQTRTPSNTGAPTRTCSLTSSVTCNPTSTYSPTGTQSRSDTPRATATHTWSLSVSSWSLTPTGSYPQTPTGTATHTTTYNPITRTVTGTRFASASPTYTNTPNPTLSPTAMGFTVTGSPSASPTATWLMTPSLIPTPTPSFTPSHSLYASNSFTFSPPSLTPMPTRTATSSMHSFSLSESTPSWTLSETRTPTILHFTLTSTRTPTETSATSTATWTGSAAETATSTEVLSGTETSTLLPTDTHSHIPMTDTFSLTGTTSMPPIFCASSVICEGTNTNSLMSCLGGGIVSLIGLDFGTAPVEPGMVTIYMHGGEGDPPSCIPTLVRPYALECGLIVPPSASGIWILSLDIQLQRSIEEHANVTAFEVIAIPGPELERLDPCMQPNACKNGEVITVRGHHFDPNVPRANLIHFVHQSLSVGESPQCQVTHSSFTQLECILTVPFATTGTWDLHASVTGVNSSNLALTIQRLDAPIVDTVECNEMLSPLQCSGGQLLTLHGGSFGSTLDDAVVGFMEGPNSTGTRPSPSCHPVAIRPGQLICILSVDHDLTALGWDLKAQTWPWLVFVEVGGVASEETMLSVIPNTWPYINEVIGCDPACGTGAVVTIAGGGFDGYKGSNSISLQTTPESQGLGGKCVVLDATMSLMTCQLELVSGTSGEWVFRIDVGHRYWVDEVEKSTAPISLISSSPVAIAQIEGCPSGPCVAGSLLKFSGGWFGNDKEALQVQFESGPETTHPPKCPVVVLNAGTEFFCALSLGTSAEGSWQVVVYVSGDRAISTMTLALKALPNPFISMILGCGDDCQPETTLTIRGGNFDANTPGNNIVTLLPEGLGQGNPPTCDTTLAEGSQLQCAFKVPPGTLGNWTVQVNITGSVTSSAQVLHTTPHYDGLHIRSIECLSSISDSGLACRGGSLLTVIGGDFGLSVGQVSTYLTGGGGTPPLCVPYQVTPSEFHCSLMVYPDTHGTWEFRVRVRGVESGNTINVACVPMPPPIITGIQGCSSMGCTQGDLMTITGSNLDPLVGPLGSGNEVTFHSTSPWGGSSPSCVVFASSCTDLQCSLQIPDSTTGLWSVGVAVNRAQSQERVNVTLFPGTVPVITNFSCTAQAESVDCPRDYTLERKICFGGALLTLYGANFGSDLDDVQVVFREGFGEAPKCHPHLISGGKFVCALAVPPGTAGDWFISLFVGPTIRANNIIAIPVTPGALPRLIGMTGCGTDIACEDGDVVTVEGRGFYPYQSKEAMLFVFRRSSGARGPSPSCRLMDVTTRVLTCQMQVPMVTEGNWTMGLQVVGTTTNILDVTFETGTPDITRVGCAGSSTGQGIGLFCPAGVMISIQGRFFGYDTNDIVVRFAGQLVSPEDQPLCSIITLTPTLIECGLSVPQEGAGLWSLQLLRNKDGLEVRSKAFLITLQSLQPPFLVSMEGCTLGGCIDEDILTIRGFHFDPYNLTSNVVLFEKRPESLSRGQVPKCIPFKVMGEALFCRVVATEPADQVWDMSVLVHGVDPKSPLTIRLNAGPQVEDILCAASSSPYPMSCVGSRSITLMGRHFGSSVSNMSIDFVGLEMEKPRCNPTSVTPTQVVCALEALLPGRWNWITTAGLESIPRPGPAFSVGHLLPTKLSDILGCHPSGCRPEDVLTIYGHNFDLHQAESNVVDIMPGADSTGPIPSCEVVAVKGPVLDCAFNVIEREYIVCNLNSSYLTRGTWTLYTITDGVPSMNLLDLPVITATPTSTTTPTASASPTSTSILRDIAFAPQWQPEESVGNGKEHQVKIQVIDSGYTRVIFKIAGPAVLRMTTAAAARGCTIKEADFEGVKSMECFIGSLTRADIYLDFYVFQEYFVNQAAVDVSLSAEMWSAYSAQETPRYYFTETMVKPVRDNDLRIWFEDYTQGKTTIVAGEDIPIVLSMAHEGEGYVIGPTLTLRLPVGSYRSTTSTHVTYDFDPWEVSAIVECDWDFTQGIASCFVESIPPATKFTLRLHEVSASGQFFAGDSLTLAASVTSRSPDADAANDQATWTLTVKTVIFELDITATYLDLIFLVPVESQWHEPGGEVECSDIIVTEYALKLGRFATCFWYTSKFIQITLGSDPTIQPGDLFSLKPTIEQMDCEVYCSQFVSEVVLQPGLFQLPQAVLSVPLSVAGCAVLGLDATKSRVSTKQMSIEWNVVAPSEVVQLEQLGFIKASLVADTLYASIPTSYLEPGEYMFTVTVTDYFGNQANQSQLVNKGLLIPPLRLLTPTPLHSFPSTTTSVIAAAGEAACTGIQGPQSSAVSSDIILSWSAPSYPGLVELADLSSDNILEFGPHVLNSGEVYTFQVAASYAGSSVSTSLLAVVDVHRSPLQVIITGAALRTASVTSQLLLDASTSYDPDAEEDITSSAVFLWSACYEGTSSPHGVQNGGVCTPKPLSSSSPLLAEALHNNPSASKPVLVLDGTVEVPLPLGWWKFEVRLTTPGRSSTAVAFIHFVESGSTSFDVNIIQELINNNAVHNDDKVLTLKAVSSTLGLTYKWTAETASGLALDLGNSSVAPLGDASALLAIAPAGLQGTPLVRVLLTAFVGGKQATAEAAISISQGPRPGSLLVDVDVLSRTVVLQAPGWGSDTTGALRYQFSCTVFTTPQYSKVLSGSPTTLNALRAPMPSVAQPTVVEYMVTVTDMYGAWEVLSLKAQLPAYVATQEDFAVLEQAMDATASTAQAPDAILQYVEAQFALLSVPGSDIQALRSSSDIVENLVSIANNSHYDAEERTAWLNSAVLLSQPIFVLSTTSAGLLLEGAVKLFANSEVENSQLLVADTLVMLSTLDTLISQHKASRDGPPQGLTRMTHPLRSVGLNVLKTAGQALLRSGQLLPGGSQCLVSSSTSLCLTPTVAEGFYAEFSDFAVRLPSAWRDRAFLNYQLLLPEVPVALMVANSPVSFDGYPEVGVSLLSETDEVELFDLPVDNAVELYFKHLPFEYEPAPVCAFVEPTTSAVDTRGMAVIDVSVTSNSTALSCQTTHMTQFLVASAAPVSVPPLRYDPSGYLVRCLPVAIWALYLTAVGFHQVRKRMGSVAQSLKTVPHPFTAPVSPIMAFWHDVAAHNDWLAWLVPDPKVSVYRRTSSLLVVALGILFFNLLLLREGVSTHWVVQGILAVALAMPFKVFFTVCFYATPPQLHWRRVLCREESRDTAGSRQVDITKLANHTLKDSPEAYLSTQIQRPRKKSTQQDTIVPFVRPNSRKSDGQTPGNPLQFLKQGATGKGGIVMKKHQQSGVSTVMDGPKSRRAIKPFAGAREGDFDDETQGTEPVSGVMEDDSNPPTDPETNRTGEQGTETTSTDVRSASLGEEPPLVPLPVSTFDRIFAKKQSQDENSSADSKTVPSAATTGKVIVRLGGLKKKEPEPEPAPPSRPSTGLSQSTRLSTPPAPGQDIMSQFGPTVGIALGIEDDVKPSGLQVVLKSHPKVVDSDSDDDSMSWLKSPAAARKAALGPPAPGTVVVPIQKAGITPELIRQLIKGRALISAAHLLLLSDPLITTVEQAQVELSNIIGCRLEGIHKGFEGDEESCELWRQGMAEVQREDWHAARVFFYGSLLSRTGASNAMVTISPDQMDAWIQYYGAQVLGVTPEEFSRLYLPSVQGVAREFFPKPRNAHKSRQPSLKSSSPALGIHSLGTFPKSSAKLSAPTTGHEQLKQPIYVRHMRQVLKSAVVADGSRTRPFTTLEGAVAVVKGGEEILLLEGEYPAMRIANPPSNITIRSAPGATVLLTHGRKHSTTPLLELVGADGVTIADLKFEYAKVGVAASHSRGTTVLNCIFRDVSEPVKSTNTSHQNISATNLVIYSDHQYRIFSLSLPAQVAVVGFVLTFVLAMLLTLLFFAIFNEKLDFNAFALALVVSFVTDICFHGLIVGVWLALKQEFYWSPPPSNENSLLPSVSTQVASWLKTPDLIQRNDKDIMQYLGFGERQKERKMSDLDINPIQGAYATEAHRKAGI